MEVNGRFDTWPLYAELPLGSKVVAVQSRFERVGETQHLSPCRQSNLLPSSPYTSHCTVCAAPSDEAESDRVQKVTC